MSLRFTEEQLEAYQKRTVVKSVNRTAANSDEYDLPVYIVDALASGVRFSPRSPLIVTLDLGLKSLQRDDGKSKPYERIEQAIALLWLECTELHAFSMTTATPFGGYRPDGAGGQLRGEGVRKGYPDILMDVPRQGYHGLRIEMKKYSSSANPSPEQHEWLTNLASEGYRAVLCRGHKAAIYVFSTYLGIATPINARNFPEWCIKYY